MLCFDCRHHRPLSPRDCRIGHIPLTAPALWLVAGIAATACIPSTPAHANDRWVEVVSFKPPDGIRGDEFGHAVAIDGDLAIVGAPGMPTDSKYDGEVFIFNLVSGRVIRRLSHPEVGNGYRFGQGVEIAGDIAFVDTYMADLVHVFHVHTGTLKRVLEGIGGATEVFGASMDADAGRLMVGASEGSIDVSQSGTVYLYDIPSGELIAYFDAPDGRTGDRFGYAVDLEGDFALIGARDAQGVDPSRRSGAAYLFDAVNGTQITRYVAPDAERVDDFGHAVALAEDYAIVGSPKDSTEVTSHRGSVYVFERSSGDFLYRLEPGRSRGKNLFGRALAVHGTTAVIGSKYGFEAEGMAYVFDVPSGNFMDVLVAEDARTRACLGTDMAFNGETVLLGAPGRLGTDDVHGFVVRYERTSPRLLLAQAGDCPGRVTFEIDGATPNAEIVLLFGQHTGSWFFDSWNCHGLYANVVQPLLPGAPVSVRTDANGRGEVTVNLRDFLCGTTYVQALDDLACEVSALLHVQ